MKKIFEYVENHGEQGLTGLLELNAPDEFNPGGGLTIAHDCIEHFKGDDGSCDKEFMAFGAMLWIRAETGRLTSQYSTYDRAMSNDLAYDVWNYYTEGTVLTCPENNLKHPEYVLKVAKATRKSIENNDNDYWKDDWQDAEKVNTFIESLKYWMTIGYRKAKKKYNNQSMALHLFEQIEKKVKNIINDLEEKDLVEIRWNYRRGDVDLYHTPSCERKDW